jgi:hypothetical protein
MYKNSISTGESASMDNPVAKHSNGIKGGECMPNHFGEHAVVIGGSVAGLMTARVLADHFDAVTVLERDRIENRQTLHRSVPQGSHVHVLLLGGQRAIASLYPLSLFRRTAGFITSFKPFPKRRDH